MHSRNTGALVLAVIVGMTACAKGEKGADTTGATTGASAAVGATTAAATPQLSDANIVALLDEANMADSAAGALAATKGTSADVKEYGRQMARDHHTLRQQVRDLATKLNLAPQPPAGDTLPQHLSKMTDSLTKQAKGAAWDRAYIDHEIAIHQAVLQLAQQSHDAAQNAELKQLIERVSPNIQSHLDKAKQIQGKLGGAAAADTTKK